MSYSKNYGKIKNIVKKIINLSVIRRIPSLLIALIGLSILIFFIARVLPGDAARFALGPRATIEAVQKLRTQLHLDDPIYIQYYYWLRDALSGNLGQSLVTFRSVSTDIVEFLPATLELVAFALIIDIIFSMSLGIIAGKYSNTWIDVIIRGIAYIFTSIPSFIFGIFFLLVFGFYLNILPVGGRLTYGVIPPPTVTRFYTIDALIAGRFDVFVDALKHIIMPGFSLAMGMIAQESRILRSGIVDTLRKEFITAAVSHGIPDRVVTFKYLLKPSMIPTVTIMALDISVAVGGAFLVELIFNWPGFSRYGTNAILMKDLNAIVAVVLVIGIIFALANIIADIIVSYLDPRIRLIQKAE